MSRVQRRRIDNILVDEGVVSREHVQEGLQIQRTTGETLSAILVDMGCVSPGEIAKLICSHYQLPFISLDVYDFNAKYTKLFPPEFLHQHKLFPFDCIGQMLLCAVTEIPNQKVLQEIPRITKRKVAFYVTYMGDIDKQLNQHCPLPENSDFLKRRRAMSASKTAGESAGRDSDKLFTEQSSENLMEALDSTWDSIFQAIEENNPREK